MSSNRIAALPERLFLKQSKLYVLYVIVYHVIARIVQAEYALKTKPRLKRLLLRLDLGIKGYGEIERLFSTHGSPYA